MKLTPEQRCVFKRTKNESVKTATCLFFLYFSATDPEMRADADLGIGRLWQIQCVATLCGHHSWTGAMALDSLGLDRADYHLWLRRLNNRGLRGLIDLDDDEPEPSPVPFPHGRN